MEVKEILNKAKKLLKDNEYVSQISETPHYYLCFIDDPKAEILDGGDIEVIIIDKANENMKRPKGIGSNMYFLPIPMDDIKNKKTIYEVKDDDDDEEPEKSTEKVENEHEFDDLDLDKIFNDPANADIFNMDIDTSLKPEDLVENPQEETPQVENPQDDEVK